jgi:hypothetical protein
MHARPNQTHAEDVVTTLSEWMPIISSFDGRVSRKSLLHPALSPLRTRW